MPGSKPRVAPQEAHGRPGGRPCTFTPGGSVRGPRAALGRGGSSPVQMPRMAPKKARMAPREAHEPPGGGAARARCDPPDGSVRGPDGSERGPDGSERGPDAPLPGFGGASGGETQRSVNLFPSNSCWLNDAPLAGFGGASVMETNRSVNLFPSISCWLNVQGYGRFRCLFSFF